MHAIHCITDNNMVFWKYQITWHFENILSENIGQKIRLRLPVLSGIRLRTKTSDSLRLLLRNPACNDTLFPAMTLTLHKATGQLQSPRKFSDVKYNKLP